MWGCSAIIELVDSKAEVFTMSIPEGGLYDDDLHQFLTVCQSAVLPIVSAHVADSSYPFGHPKRLELYLYINPTDALAHMQVADLKTVNGFFQVIRDYDIDTLPSEAQLITNI